MERYRFLEHTADAKFQAFGKTLEDAFCNAALATASLMWDWEEIEQNVKHPVEIPIHGPGCGRCVRCPDGLKKNKRLHLGNS